MSKVFAPAKYLPPTVSADGKWVTLAFVGPEGEPFGFMLRSPDNAYLIADLQHADALARERYRGAPQEAGSLVQMTVREPKTVAVTHEPLTGAVILVFDPGTETEMAFRLPAGGEYTLAERLLPSLRRGRETPTRQ